MRKTAIILGATGLTGSLLLKKLLEDNRYDQIKVFSRKSIGVNHTKLREFIGDILDLGAFEKDFIGDEVYCCIGTTAKKTPDKDLYRRIDFGIPVQAARLCKKNKINTFIVMSSLGANPKSNVFYNKTKGKMEESVLKENILNIYVLRPSIIIGNRNENRLGEDIGKKLMSAFQFLMIGNFKKYRPIEADNIAKAMIILANSKPDVQIIESDKIEELSRD